MRATIVATVTAILAGCGGGNQASPVAAPAPPVATQEPPPTPVVPVATAPPPAPPCFRLYESLAYSGKPDLTLLGFSTISQYDPSHEPDGVLSTDARDTVIIDWEISGTTIADAIAYGRKSGYRGPLSLYAMLPKRDYWRALSAPDSASYKQWQSENDALRPYVAKVAAIYPSLYTFYSDQDKWVTYATANMAEGRRIAPSKKMYPYLWPEYHSAAGGELSADYWLKELRLVRDHADGAVIWGGWDFANKRPQTWNNNAAWWKATQEFIAETNVCAN